MCGRVCVGVLCVLWGVFRGTVKTLLCNSYVICVLEIMHFYHIFLQKHLTKVAELMYIARLYYYDA